MPSHILALLLLAIFPIVAIACGGGGYSEPNTAEAALRHQVDLFEKGQWGRHWDLLHPVQQALIPRDHYIDCNSDNDPISIDELKIIEVFQEDTTIPPSRESVAGTALTIEITARSGWFSDTLTDTVHQVNVDGAWRWALAAPEEYADGDCPL